MYKGNLLESIGKITIDQLNQMDAMFNMTAEKFRQLNE